MKFRIMLAASSVALMLSSTALAQKLNLPSAERVTLPNGIRLVLMEYHKVPTLTVSALFTGGTATDPADKAGLTGLMADLMRKGTATRTAPQLAEQVDFLGGSLGAFSTVDYLGVNLGVLAKDTDTALELFTDVIRNPSFPKEELERERQLALSGLQSLKEDPAAVAERVANQTVYSGHPYGMDETITTVKAIQRDDILACYKRIVVPNRMIIVAVGDFKTADMLSKLKAKFGDWPQQFDSLPATTMLVASPRKFVVVDKPDATQTQARFVRTGFAKGNKDQFAADIASGILGGGFTSRLVDEVRVNKSLTYSIGSSFTAARLGGRFEVSTFTKIETTRALINSVSFVLKKSAEQGLKTAELLKVKSYLVGLFAIKVQTPEALAAELSQMAFYGLPNNYLETRLERIKQVKLEDINRIAKAYFAPENLSLILVAPLEKIKIQLKGLPEPQVISIDSIGK